MVKNKIKDRKDSQTVSAFKQIWVKRNEQVRKTELRKRVETIRLTINGNENNNHA